MGLGGRAENARSGRKITMAEVQKHAAGSDDAWMVVNGKVYDVSNWHEHPGGRVIFTHAGDDATDPFGAFHPKSAYKLLERFYVGDVVAEDSKMTPFEREYRQLRVEIRKQGLEKANMLFYAYKTIFNVGLLALAFYVAWAFDSFAMHMLSAAIVALFWQQCGWLAHDYLHHQVFDNRFIGDLFGIVIGNVFQGFSVEWWKNKHNTHHAIPNLHESAPDAHDGDPDIDTMPLLAWSLNMARKASECGAVGRFFVKHQAFLYFPILFVARLSWLMQSFQFVFRLGNTWGETRNAQPLRLGWLEHGGLALYYGWYIGLMATCMPVTHAIAYFFASQMFCGFLLAIAFGVGHNGMATYEKENKPDFGSLQITTTRNVHDHWLNGWFMGGLHYQIEHHLFPYIPRHNLKAVRAMVEPLCAKHGIPYRCTGLFEGSVETLTHLSDVTNALVKEFPGL